MLFLSCRKNAATYMHCAIVKDTQESEKAADKSTLKDLLQRGVHCARNQSAFLLRDYEGRSEEDVIAVCAIDAALRWVGKNIFVEGGSANALSDVLFFGKWCSRRFVFDELDAEEQAQAADFTYMRVRLQGG
jgi:hypothetical protein